MELYMCRLLDYLICDMISKELQRIMRVCDNYTLCLAMKGMSREARKHIFENFS